MNSEAARRDRAICAEITVDAPVGEVWDAWTTEDGIKSFFAPDCNVDLRVDGLYEIFFAPEAPEGERGADGMRLLAVEPGRMLSFTWNAPLHLKRVRGQRTHVVLWFDEAGEGRTRLALRHGGWGEGEEWDRAFEYFEEAWLEVVLPRLKYRFSVGPVDWKNPPRLMKEQ
jgi:uncharacterized protein YndB with AHSA1/START domain